MAANPAFLGPAGCARRHSAPLRANLVKILQRFYTAAGALV